ncbi:MAG: hypothetical protein DRP51_01155 [Candidatus Zixiibacteriota bacterium]|nr:MAG: hypothetical protein DRP51_01155 [candidate division Zixibacteria bacterium]
MPIATRGIIKSEMLLSQANPKSLAGKIVLFPLSRIIIAVLFLAPVALIHLLFETEVLPVTPEQYKAIVAGIEASVTAVLLCLIIAVIILNKVVERKQIIAPIWQRKGLSRQSDLPQTA